ncbi:MAG: helix-turn-helix domain-containing protein [Sphingobacterium sp.]
MRKIVIICVFLLSYQSFIFGQEAKRDEFDKRYIEVNVSLVATNVAEAERVADSLLSVASNDEQKIKSNMLLAKIYENKGDMSRSIKSAMKANSLAEMTLNHSWQAVTSGLLSTTFRRLGLMKMSERYLIQAEKANEKQIDKERQVLTKINIAHEWYFHAVAENDYHKAKKYVLQAATQIKMDGTEDKRALLIKATNDQLHAICELHTGNINKTDSLLHASIQKLGTMETNLKPYIYRVMAESALAKKNLGEARKCLDLIEPYLKEKNVEELEMLTCETKAVYYKLSGDLAKSQDYLAQATNIKENNNKLAQRISDDLIEEFGTGKEVYENRYMMAVVGLLVVILSFTVFGGYLILLKRHYKKRYYQLKEREPAEHLDESNLVVADIQPLLQSKPGTELKREGKEINISKETEERLYQGFVFEEQDQFYIDRSTSLAKLANSMGTNQRYASYIVQKYRNMDFYTYLQTNRINYIIDRIKKDPTLLDFKLSHLAKLCGFSSLSTFSTAFKNQTGLPPSAFVHFTKKELEQSAGQ